MLGAEVSAVVDVESCGQTAAQDSLFEHGQEGGGILGVGEGRVGDDASGVVDEGDEIGFAFTAVVVGDGGSVHDVAHPQFCGFVEGEAAPVS